MERNNLRGYLKNGGKKKPGPQTPESSRKSPWRQKVEAAEKATADHVRANDFGLTGDEICAKFIRECEKRGCDDYYACVAGIGSNSMRSWRWKFEGRFGLRNCSAALVHKSTRDNALVYNVIMRSWANFEAVVQQCVDSGADREHIYLVNMDEVGLRKSKGDRTTLPAERLQDDCHGYLPSARKFETDLVPFSIGNCCTTAPGMEIIPLVVVHAKTKAKKEVLSTNVQTK